MFYNLFILVYRRLIAGTFFLLECMDNQFAAHGQDRDLENTQVRRK